MAESKYVCVFTGASPNVVDHVEVAERRYLVGNSES